MGAPTGGDERLKQPRARRLGGVKPLLLAADAAARAVHDLPGRRLALAEQRRDGCAYCLDMHTKDARALGETEQRIYALSAWRETPFFTDRERAALEWTDAVTRVSQDQVPDAIYEAVTPHFTETELVALTFAVVAINAWNRLAISFRAVPGSYQSPHARVA